MTSEKTLNKMIEEVLKEVLQEVNPRQIPPTQPTDPVGFGHAATAARIETPGERKKRLKQAWSQGQSSDTMDPNTEEGRDNLVKSIVLDYGDIGTRINILTKLGRGAAVSNNRQEFKAGLIQMYDNLTKLQNKDLPQLLKSYGVVAKQLGFQTQTQQQESSLGLNEADLNPDSPTGRQTLMSKVLSELESVAKLFANGKSMLDKAAESSNSIPVFKNELLLLGKTIAAIRSHLYLVNKAFVATFKEYEKQRGRPSQ